jgi:predicted methyltransferase
MVGPYATPACASNGSAQLGLLRETPSARTLSPVQIARIVASPDRSAADRTNDQHRRPKEMLDFIGIRPTLHRIEEAFLRKEVEAAGFKLLAEGNFLRNPNDPRDKNTPDPA